MRFNRNITVSAKSTITILNEGVIAEKYCPENTTIHYLANTSGIHYITINYLGKMLIYSELSRSNNNCQFDILFKHKS